ncbi:MAG: hypothetical protein U5L09_11515 [Bacteroidales bacterium]|nr:hypothetical protein [Bacteroidales bacterium]
MTSHTDEGYGDIDFTCSKGIGFMEELQSPAEINKCYEVALGMLKAITQQFLQWYFEEQVEEESTMNGILG